MARESYRRQPPKPRETSENVKETRRKGRALTVLQVHEAPNLSASEKATITAVLNKKRGIDPELKKRSRTERPTPPPGVRFGQEGITKREEKTRRRPPMKGGRY
jgi:hypothetical protein